MAFGVFGSTTSNQSTGFNFGATPSSTPGFGGFGAPAASAAAPAFGATSSPSTFGSSSAAFSFGQASTPAFGSSTPAFGSSTPALGQASAPGFGSSTPALGFGLQQSQPNVFGASQQPQQQNQQQLSLFGASQQPQQQTGLFGSAQGQQQQQPQPYNAAQLAAGVAPASQEIAAISRGFDKNSSEFRFRHLFLNAVDNPQQYGCPKGIGDLDWRVAINRAGGINNPNRLWPVAVSGFDELLKRKDAQDQGLRQHAQRLENAVNLAHALQRNEETALRDRIAMVKRTHASLSDQLLRIMRALDALEGQFAVASHQHNSKTYQIHEALSKDLSHLEAGLAPNSAVGLLSRAEVLAAAAAMQGDTPAQTKSQALSQNDVESMQHLLLQSTKVLANLQEVLRKDNRDIAIMADFQQTNGVSRMVP